MTFFEGSNVCKCFRYREAEVDCTEALNLDDRYIKAYSRRATARKQLGMIKEAKEGNSFRLVFKIFKKFLFSSCCLKLIADAEFALRLEPESEELKKQYADIKSLLEKVSNILIYYSIHQIKFICITKSIFEY